MDSKSIDDNANIPGEVMKSLKELGLFGLQIPEEFGKKKKTKGRHFRAMSLGHTTSCPQ